MNEQKNNLYIPAAILLAGFVIAGAVYFTNKTDSPSGGQVTTETKLPFKEVSESDHILGNPNAPIVILEYSDTECPFCKVYHTTMHSIIDSYGKDGKVAWVYRHFPLDSLHSKTRKEAEATECANELGGNKGFWSMIDKIYTNTPSNDGLDAKLLPTYAKEIGLDQTKFNECLSSGKYAASVEAQYQDGIKAGAQGTPYNVMLLKTALSTTTESYINSFITQNRLSNNVVIISDKKEIILNGALPFDFIKTIIEAIIKK